ncbi:MAG: DUF3883 domain-containing protein [Candidatus Gastranaerophilales bacterium]|nr:DUF3883 domain-containing protein [Candidatus Gastranaerophilales bacterium]
MATKSDVKAKNAFIVYLQQQGYTAAKIISQPADIEAWKEGEKYYFEIKMTRQAKSYFGAATLTEWDAAMKYPGRYFFVIALTDEAERTFSFSVMPPEEFIMYSTIPPFKIFFNIDLNKIINPNLDKNITQGWDGICDYRDEDSINKVVRKMGESLTNNGQEEVKYPRKKTTKLTTENLKKMIDMFKEMKNDQGE